MRTRCWAWFGWAVTLLGLPPALGNRWIDGRHPFFGEVGPLLGELMMPRLPGWLPPALGRQELAVGFDEVLTAAASPQTSRFAWPIVGGKRILRFVAVPKFAVLLWQSLATTRCCSASSWPPDLSAPPMLWLRRWNFIERARLERELWDAFEGGENLDLLLERCHSEVEAGAVGAAFRLEVWQTTLTRIRRLEILMKDRPRPRD